MKLRSYERKGNQKTPYNAQYRDPVYEERIVDGPLPQEVADLLQKVHGTDYLAPYLCTLRFGSQYGGDCWTLQNIANALGITRERVRQIEYKCVSTHHKSHDLLTDGSYNFIVPKAARKTVLIGWKYRDIPQEVVEELKLLRQKGTLVRGNIPLDDVRRLDAEKYAKRLAEVVKTYSANRVAKAMGISRLAIKGTLVRYGYDTSTGKSKVFQPVKKQAPNTDEGSVNGEEVQD